MKRHRKACSTISLATDPQFRPNLTRHRGAGPTTSSHSSPLPQSHLHPKFPAMHCLPTVQWLGDTPAWAPRPAAGREPGLLQNLRAALLTTDSRLCGTCFNMTGQREHIREMPPLQIPQNSKHGYFLNTGSWTQTYSHSRITLGSLQCSGFISYHYFNLSTWLHTQYR